MLFSKSFAALVAEETKGLLTLGVWDTHSLQLAFFAEVHHHMLGISLLGSNHLPAGRAGVMIDIVPTLSLSLSSPKAG